MRLLKLYREAYTGMPREIWVLAGLTLVNRMGTMVLPFLTIYLTHELGFAEQQAGWLMSAFGVGALGGTFAGGKVTDRVGGKQVIFFSLLLGGVFFILLQFAESFGAFYALMLVTAFFGEAYRPALTTLVGTYSRPGETGRSIAFLRLAINLGMSAAPALGGLIALQLGYPYLFWIDGITCIAAALLFGWLAAGWQGNQVGEGEEKKVEDSPSSPSLPPHRQPAFLLFLVSTLLFGLVFVQGYFTLPVFLKSEWQYNEDLIGLLMGFSSFMIVLVEMPLVHSLEKSGKVRLSVLWGMALLGICFLPFLLPEALWLAFFVMFIYTMGEILYLPFNNILPLEMAPKGKQGEYLAWYWMTWSLCNILGPGLGLGIAGVWGYPKLWLVLLGMAGLSWVLMRKVGEKVPRSSQES